MRLDLLWKMPVLAVMVALLAVVGGFVMLLMTLGIIEG